MKSRYGWIVLAVGMIGMAVATQAQDKVDEATPPPVPPSPRPANLSPAMMPGAQSNTPRGMGMGGGMGGKWGAGMMGGMSEDVLIERLLKKSELTTELGLTDEQIAKLKSAVDELRKQQRTLRVDRERAGLEQARLMLETNINEQAVMAAVEKAGKAETELAKLQVKQLLLLRNTLSQEQIEKLREQTRQRIQKMKDMRDMRDKQEKDNPAMGPPRMKEIGRGHGSDGTGTNLPPVPPAPPGAGAQ